MGRKKQPLEQALLIGADSQHPARYKNRGSTKYCEKLHVEQPAFLNIETKNAWDSVVPRLETLKILAAQDIALLLAMFDCYEQFTTSKKLLAALDSQLINADIKDPETMEGVRNRKQLAAQVSMHLKDFCKIASLFGLSPSDRNNITIEPPQELDPIDILLGNN